MADKGKFSASTKWAADHDTWTYTDMRGHPWRIEQAGTQSDDDVEFRAYPIGSALDAYGLPAALYFTQVWGANSAARIIQDIESKLEAARAAGQSPGAFYDTNPGAHAASSFPWWLVALGLWAWSENKGRR